MLYYDTNYKIYNYDTGNLTPIDLTLDEEPEAYIGEIWFDKLQDCIMDDREILYWYTYDPTTNSIVKHDWQKRFDDGEFTLDQFRDKVLLKIKNDYIRKTETTDADFLMYQKRSSLDLLEPGDADRYEAAQTNYKNYTTAYREKRDALKAATDIASLIAAFQ